MSEPERNHGGPDDKSVRPRYPGPADWFTVPGLLLLIFTILACAATFVWYFLATSDNLPAGSYPIFFWLFPILTGGLFFFLIAAFLLEKLGIRIYRRRGD
jgi:uncharacterized RDD family membrane protein YckC